MEQMRKLDVDSAKSLRQNVPMPTPETRQVETVEAFKRRTKPRIDGSRARKAVHANKRARTKLSDIKFPEQTGNMAALRFTLRVTDAVFVTTIILLSIWSSYVGVNNKAVIAPLAAGLSGAIGFSVALCLMKAHQFSPAEIGHSLPCLPRL